MMFHSGRILNEIGKGRSADSLRVGLGDFLQRVRWKAAVGVTAEWAQHSAARLSSCTHSRSPHCRSGRRPSRLDTVLVERKTTPLARLGGISCNSSETPDDRLFGNNHSNQTGALYGL